MSTADIEKQNNGDAETIVSSGDVNDTTDGVKEGLKLKPVLEETISKVVFDNGSASQDGTGSKEDICESTLEETPAKEQNKATKRPTEMKYTDAKKLKKDKVDDRDSDEEEDVFEDIIEDDSEEGNEYNIPYDDDEDDIECDDDDDDQDEDSGSDDDQA